MRSAGAGSIPVLPLSFRLYPLTFPPLPSIHIGGWDYLEGHGAYDADPGNIADFLKILPANYVDTPYAGGGAGPGGGKFDPEGKLTTEFDFSVWDEWTAKWPGARQYAVFVNVPDNIAGEKIDHDGSTGYGLLRPLRVCVEVGPRPSPPFRGAR